MLLLFCGESQSRDVRPSGEGTLEWHPLDNLPYDEMVEDLSRLLPLLLDTTRPTQTIYGHYAPNESGDMQFRFNVI